MRHASLHLVDVFLLEVLEHNFLGVFVDGVDCVKY